MPQTVAQVIPKPRQKEGLKSKVCSSIQVVLGPCGFYRICKEKTRGLLEGDRMATSDITAKTQRSRSSQQEGLDGVVTE